MMSQKKIFLGLLCLKYYGLKYYGGFSNQKLFILKLHNRDLQIKSKKFVFLIIDM